MIHDNITHLMRERDLTPEALAVAMQRIGKPVTAGTVRSWMTGDRVPGFQNMIGLTTALGCSADDLLQPSRATSMAEAQRKQA